MQINMSETMRECLEKCVQFAIGKNAWISAIDYAGDEEVTMEEAFEVYGSVKACEPFPTPSPVVADTGHHSRHHVCGQKVLAWQREQPRFVSNQLGHGL